MTFAVFAVLAAVAFAVCRHVWDLAETLPSRPKRTGLKWAAAIVFCSILAPSPVLFSSRDDAVANYIFIAVACAVFYGGLAFGAGYIFRRVSDAIRSTPVPEVRAQIAKLGGELKKLIPDKSPQQIYSDLETISRLRQQGVLTEEEYGAERDRLKSKLPSRVNTSTAVPSSPEPSRHSMETILSELGTGADDITAAAAGDDLQVGTSGAAAISAIIGAARDVYGITVSQNTIFAAYLAALEKQDFQRMTKITREMAAAISRLKDPKMKGPLIYFWFTGQKAT